MQNTQDFIPLGVIREDAILTTSYVAATVISSKMTNYDVNPQLHNQLLVFIKYTKGSLTSLELKLEFSLDGTTYFQETAKSISGGTSTDTALEHTFAPSGNQNFVLAIPIKYPYIKISAKGTGTVTTSSLELSVAVGVQ